MAARRLISQAGKIKLQADGSSSRRGRRCAESAVTTGNTSADNTGDRRHGAGRAVIIRRYTEKSAIAALEQERLVEQRCAAHQ